jgi:Zn-dependent M16 (insulinase) family peptidase
MFEKFFDSIGTQKTSYDKFDNKLLSCTNGLSVSLDAFGDQE